MGTPLPRANAMTCSTATSFLRVGVCELVNCDGELLTGCLKITQIVRPSCVAAIRPPIYRREEGRVLDIGVRVSLQRLKVLAADALGNLATPPDSSPATWPTPPTPRL